MTRLWLTEWFVSFLMIMYTVDCRLTCLVGTDVPFPRDARRVMECGSEEYCSLEQYITPSGYLRHKAACKDTHNCGGVTVQSTDMVICSECCDNDMCSTTLCNQKGFDLQYGPLCYHCDYPVDQPDHCDTIRVCQDNEVCSVVKTITGEYRVGCSAKNACETAVKAGVCASCCTDMLCNRNCTTNKETGTGASSGITGHPSASTETGTGTDSSTSGGISGQSPASIETGTGTSGETTGHSSACSDRIINCNVYSSSVCSNPQYTDWVIKNCQSFCNKCSSINTGTSGGTTTSKPSGPEQCIPALSGYVGGCTYKGKTYRQGQTWKDHCHYSCTCTNGSNGHYKCKPLCGTWNLHPACHMNPPARGKCCPTPYCPAGFTIHYPPGYVAN